MSLTFYGIAYLVIKLASDAVNNQLLLSTSAGSRYCKVSIWFSYCGIFFIGVRFTFTFFSKVILNVLRKLNSAWSLMKRFL